MAVAIVLLFLTYFGDDLALNQEEEKKALNKLELILAKEKELDSIGHQAAAAAHSLGTPFQLLQ